MSSEIIPLFADALYLTNINRKFTTEELTTVDLISKDLHKNTGNWTSNNRNVLDSYFLDIRNFIQEHINNYVKDIISPEESIEVYITQSWINVTHPTESHHQHTHPNSFISGVFYFSVEELVDSIIFSKKHEREIVFPSKISNQFNSSNYFLKLSNGDLVIFPSNLPHHVDNTISKNPRISLSFNTFIKGQLGINDNLTGLYLK